MSRGRKITVMVVTVVGIVSTPFFWLLDNPDTGQLVAASVQGATGIVALIWALFQQSPAPTPGARDTAVDTGEAKVTHRGTASTGVRRPHGVGSGSARAERTGDASADGSGSHASTGVDYS